MHRSATIALAYILNIILGSFCLVSVSYAATPATGAELVPMSREMVECPWMNTEDFNAQEESPCANGECIAKEKAPVPCTAAAIQILTAATLPEPQVIEDSALPDHTEKLGSRNERPPPLIGIRTVVLRR